MQFLANPLSKHLARMPDGSLLVRSSPIARTGTQLYLPHEVFQDGAVPRQYQGQAHIRVIRSSQEVLSARTIASAEGAVLTDSHPPVFIDPSNFSTYQKGHIQNVRQGPATPDGEQTLVADLIVRDRELSSDILLGRKRNLSLGYSCSYSEQSNGTMLQTDIEVNHCAVVAIGRAGPSVAIMDDLPSLPLTPVFEKMGALLARAFDELPVVRPAITDFFAELEQGPANSHHVAMAYPEPEKQGKKSDKSARSILETKNLSGSEQYADAMRRCWRK
jgi:hypothetical protein